jgi:hypothetical protein
MITSSKINIPFLTVSIFGNPTEMQLCLYSIEVTQKERILREGDLHIGFL